MGQLWGFWCCSVIKITNKFKSTTEMWLDPRWMRSFLSCSCCPLSFLRFLLFTHYSMTTISTTEPGIASFYSFRKNLLFFKPSQDKTRQDKTSMSFYMLEVSTNTCDCCVPTTLCASSRTMMHRSSGKVEEARLWRREGRKRARNRLWMFQ